MASRTVTALDQLNHIIDATFSNIKQFEQFDHQVEDGLMRQQESNRMRFIVGTLWDLKLQIHMFENKCTQLTDVIGDVISLMLDLYLEYIIPRSLFVCVCMHLYSR